MSLGLLFPGQGTQHPEMLPWLETDERRCSALKAMHANLGADWREKLRDPAWAQCNAHAQVLLSATCLVAWEQLSPLLPAPKAVAGYSVGELPAMAAAGVISPVDAIALAQRRAMIMDACVQGIPTGLMAVSGIGEKAIQLLCLQYQLYPAIQLGPESVILGGGLAAIRTAQGPVEALGGTVKPLAVSLASHTPFMAEGVAPLLAVLNIMTLSAPRATPILNATGQPVFQPDRIRKALADQIAQTVRWDACMGAMAEQGVTCVLEVGPGATLSKLWNARFPQIPARSADEFRQAEGAAQWVRSRLAR